MVQPSDFKYGELYWFYTEKSNRAKTGVYLGNDFKGMGRILSKIEESPRIYSFNIENAKLEGGEVIKYTRFNRLYLTEKENSFALEILTKKGL